MRSVLRYLRHGPLKHFHRIWIPLGKYYQFLVKTFPIVFPPAKQKIGAYGPFCFHPCFAFSAFHQWGDRHNAGFAACIENCRNKHCVLDIGAHIGLVAMPMSRMLAPNGYVYAFEPANANRRYLNYHLKKNRIKNTKVIPLLVGNHNNDGIPFYELNGDTGMNSVMPMEHQDNFKASTKQQITVDHFCKQYQLKPEVIKIDVEGYELEVLQGAKETLTQNKIQIYLSIHPRHMKALGHTPPELMHYIHALGYRITELDGSPIQTFRLSEYLVQPANENNKESV